MTAEAGPNSPKSSLPGPAPVPQLESESEDTGSETFAPESGPERDDNGPSGAPGDAETGVDPDAATVAAAQAGDDQAFEQLVVKHQDRIYSNIYFMVHDRELASDLAQECFLRAYRGLSSFRAEARFATWLKRISVNVTLHHFERSRAQKRSGRVFSISQATGEDSEGDYEIEDPSRAPESVAIDQEHKQAILDAVGDLEPEYRMALTLRELEGYSYGEIQEALGLPIGTVKSKIFRARQILQEKLKDLL